MAFRLNSSCISRLLLCAVVVLSLFGALRLGAQAVGGTILGTVTDPAGAAIPKADVTITNTATGVVTTVTTSPEGFYSVPNLLPGTYTVAAKAEGFSTAVVNGVTLTVGAQQTINIALKVGETSQRVEVTTTAVAVELASSTISDVVSGTQVVDMPLNGRSWTDLAQLQPGVNAVHTQPAASTSDRASRGWGQALTVSGQRPTSNNYTLNGVSLNDNMNTAPGSFLAGNLGVDSVGEFSVLTGNFSAQYGKSAGGIINAITKSGTNQFHGDAYEFLRNSAMDAKNFFDPPGKIAPFKQNQFGASAGLPIQKDKTFVFGDFEGLRRNTSLSQVATVLSPAAQAGNLCSPPNCATTHSIMDPSLGLQDPINCPSRSAGACTYNIGGTVPPSSVNCPADPTKACTAAPPYAINPNVAPFIPLWPSPNAGLICPFTSCVAGAGDTGLYAFNELQITPENFVTVRVDRKLGDKDSLWGTFLLDRQHQSQPDSLNDLTTGRFINRQTWTVEDSHAFSPTLVNVARVGFNRQTIDSPSGATALNPIAKDTTLGIASGQTIGRIVAPPLTPFQGGLTLWQAANSTWNSFQESDDLFYTRGIHALKFGFTLERDQSNTGGPGGFAGGWSTFSNIPEFLDGSPVSLIANSGPGDRSTHFRQWVWGAYAQDDMRLTRRLTINAGLRYEYASNLTSHHSGTLANLECQACPFPIMQAPLDYNPPLQAIVNQFDPAPVYGPIVNVPRLNFEPRVGFAWDAFGDGKTAVRGAFGVYDVLLLFYAQEATDWPGLQSSNSSQIAPETWPKGTFSTSVKNINTKRAFWQEHTPKLNYIMQWNLSIQHQFTNTLSMLVGYVGDRSVHDAFHFDDFNVSFPMLVPGQPPLWPCGTITTPAGQSFNPTTDCSAFGSFPKINCCIGREPGRIWNSGGVYHGLQVGVNKALGHGLSVQGSYTFSKNLDGSSGTTIGDPYVNSISSSLYYWNPALRYGLSDTNITHNLVVSYIWMLPTLSTSPSILRAIAGGWQTGGILTIQTGQPMTAIVSGDAIGENNTDPISYPNRLTGSGCGSLVNPGNVQHYIKTECLVFPTPIVFNGTNWLTGGNLGRNSIIGPGLGTLDFSLFKNNYVKKFSESFNAQFRFEAFNVFNRPNFAPPTDNEFPFDQTGAPIPGFGAIDSTITTSRQLQVALKVIW
jgi:hypothetical protein